MEAVRALIVDDEPAARRRVELLLEEDHDFEIVGICGDGEAMLERILETAPDLVFLDVRMPGADGFQALARLEKGQLPFVILVTAYDRYAVQAFETHAIDFLLKPYSRARFREACERAKRSVRARAADESSARVLALLETLSRRLPADGDAVTLATGSRPFAVRSRGRITFVNESDLLWVGAARDYVRLHTPDGSHLIRDTMSQLEEQLDPARFTRIHRSTIVRVDAIARIQTKGNGRCYAVLSDGTELVMSRSGKHRLERTLGLAI